MKNKLLAVTLSAVVLSPLALIFSHVVLSPFDSAAENQNSLPMVENYLPLALNSDDLIDDFVDEEISASEQPSAIDLNYQ